MENFGLLTSLQLTCGAFKGYVWQMYWDYYCVFSFGEYIKSIYKILVLNIFLVMYIFPAELELRHGIIPFKSSFPSQAQPEVSLQGYSCLQVQHTSLLLLACLFAFVNLTSVYILVLISTLVLMLWIFSCSLHHEETFQLHLLCALQLKVISAHSQV